LRRHPGDIPALVEHFLRGRGKDGAPRRVSAAAARLLMAYQWPGNVRELRYTVEVLCVAAAGRDEVDVKTVQTVLNLNLDEPPSEQPHYAEAKARVLAEFETRYFSDLLREHGGNVSRAARAAGMHRPNVIKKLNALGISASTFRAKA
jgi:DNA-binding NtrC family response regulator